MREFKVKELLEYFDGMCLFLANHQWTERDERAVAIREMIQKKITVTEEFMEKWAIKLSGYYMPRSTIIQMLKEAGVEVVEK